MNKTMIVFTLLTLLHNFQITRACGDKVTLYETETNPENPSQDMTTYYYCCLQLTQKYPKPQLKQRLISSGQPQVDYASLNSLSRRVDILETLVQEIAKKSDRNFNSATNPLSIDRE